MATSTERVVVKLPAGFKAEKHQRAIEKKIAEKHGEGFEIDSIESRGEGEEAYMVAVATRAVAITEVTQAKGSPTKEVRLTRNVKPSDGDKQAVKLADQHGDGWEMTKFEPFLFKAVLTKLTPDEARCRGAVSTALGVKPWDVQVKGRLDGGFDLELPKSYQPSKHDAKLEDVAVTVVGNEGWYVTADAKKLTASIIPSDPPTFPAAIPFPMRKLGKGTLDESPFGMALPAPGETVGSTVSIDWTAQAFALLAGTPGSGKSVTLNALVAYNRSNGSELVIVDDPSKAVDFMWCKDYVRDGGWGCDSDRGAVATLQMVYNEGKRRGQILADKGYVNWLDMPESERFKPIFIVVDEVSALLVTDKIPSGIPKDHPLVREAAESNLMKIQLGSLIGKIIAEQRFVGMRMILSTQVTNNNTGVSPSLKAKIGHKILQGANPSKSARGQAFSDESAVPVVPENVKGGGKAAKGVGVADLEGMTPVVYKSYYASVDAYRDAFAKLGLSKSSRPAPTAAEIAKYTPSLDDDEDAKSQVTQRRAAMADPMAAVMGDSGLDENGRPLKGAALAAAQSRVLTNMATAGGRA